MSHEKFMRIALAEARKGFKKGEVPVGAVVVVDGKIIAKAHNLCGTLVDPTAHAEILALRMAAKKLDGWWLKKHSLYTTLEPCPMCAGAIINAWVKELIYGADDPISGACGSIMNVVSSRHLDHKVKVTKGVLKKECHEIFQRFLDKLKAEQGLD